MTEFDPNQFAALKAALADLSGPGPSVPRELDHAILLEARRSFAARRRRWVIAQRIGAGLAAAAVLMIAVRVFVPAFRSSAPPSQRPQLAQAADINRDGRVDILDAFIVARHISRGEALDPAWDINGDGVVDQKDVDLIAHLAVRADGGKPQ
jgi:hypothetical protein